MHSSRRIDGETVGKTWRSSGLVLVIDDEPGIVRYASRLLSTIGFEVRSATDGPTGLQLFKDNESRTRLILLDRTMPGLSGDQLMAEIHRIRPNLPVVISSGYLPPVEIERLRRAGAAGFVAKPYERDELVGAVRGALSETGSR